MRKSQNISFVPLVDQKTGQQYWADRDIQMQLLLRQKSDAIVEVEELERTRNLLILEGLNYQKEHQKVSTNIVAQVAQINRQATTLRRHLTSVTKAIRNLRKEGKPSFSLTHSPFAKLAGLSETPQHPVNNKAGEMTA